MKRLDLSENFGWNNVGGNSWDNLSLGYDFKMEKYPKELFSYTKNLYDSGDTCLVQNISPVANAGQDRASNVKATVFLDGTSSHDSDGSIVSYSWTQTSGPTVTLTDADTATPSFTAPASSGTLTFKLTVTDNKGATATDYVNVSVLSGESNKIPTANAGADQTATASTSVTLYGTGSYDSDGSIASYSWTQTGGANISLTGGSTATPSFTAPSTEATLTFKLTVTDNKGASASDYVLVFVTASGGGGSPPPAPPSGVTAIAGNGQVTISWNAISGESYNIYWSTTSGVTKTNGTKVSNVTSPYIHTGRTNGTTYYHVVTAVNSYGESAESSQVSATPNIVISTWEKTFGGIYDDYGNSVQQTSDGGYVVAGSKLSSAGGYDVYLIKTDADGNKLWEKLYGGTGNEYGNSVRQTSDGGFIIAGYTNSGKSSYDAYLIKTDASGNSIWERTYGGSSDDGWISVRQTSDGGYIVTGDTGATYTFSGTWHYHDGGDVYLVKTDSSGNILWGKTFGGSYGDIGLSIQQTIDGGYVISGWKGTLFYEADVYLIKTDSSGNKTWEKTFGSWYSEYGDSVWQTMDGGYIVSGTTNSYGVGGRDIYLIKTDANGNSVWNKTFGGASDERGGSVQQTSDGGYIIGGYTYSLGSGGRDAYLLKIGSNGNKLWERTFGGIYDDSASSLQQTSDSGYVIAGWTSSFGTGGIDVFLIKTDSSGNVETQLQSSSYSPAKSNAPASNQYRGGGIEFMPSPR